MHSLLSRVLEQRQLNSAGQLFTMNDYDVITDLHTAFQCIKNIFNSCEYVDNRIDQSVVEIVIARITAAIRETGSIETYSAELVDVLDICLQHKMTTFDDNGKYVDSPHCKIANDLLSSLFLHYSKKSVMTLTLPVAIKALGCSNHDLVRNVTSYISLAAIHNGKTLSNYAIDIISHVIKGNYSLLRVLPQIYSDNREPFHAHLSPLMAVLDEHAADCSEKLSLLQLASLLANYKPELLLPYLGQFEKFLKSPSTCTAVLNIFMSLVSQGKAEMVSSSLPSLRKISSDPEFVGSLGTITKIIGNIGRVSLPLATRCVDDLMACARTADPLILSTILSEIEGIAALYPSCLRPYLDNLRDIRTSNTSRTIERIIGLTGVSSDASHSNAEVTVIRVPDKTSCDSLLSKTSLRGNDIITSGSRTVFSISDSPADCSTQELDRNTHSLAMQYQNRSSGSLSKNQSRSHASVAGGYRSTSENVTMSGSRDLSVCGSVAGGSSRVPADYVTRPPPQYQPPKIQNVALNGSSSSSSSFYTGSQHIQIGKDGRVRPVPSSGRRMASQCYETTFPANAGPITTTKMLPLTEEDDNREWENGNITKKSATALVSDRSDVVQQFVDHRRNKIRRFIQEISARFPIPIQCTVEGSKSSKHRMIVHFACQARAEYCVFNEDYLFNFKTKLPASWLHLMFLQMQSTSIETTGQVIAQSSAAYLKLSNCWQCLPSSVTKNRPFVTLVTSAFPTTKDQDRMLKEMENASFFDCFSLDGPSNRWQCFSCSNPDKVKSFVEDGACAKVLEGQLKEKRGRWRFVRRWHTKYFTLSSAALTPSSIKNPNNNWSSNNCNSIALPAIDLKNIRSVRSLSRGRKNRKSLRRAFEIFTADNTTVVLKATDEKKAEEWLQCLQIAVAHARREI
ncbi:unnamed protein product [Auanema sp. JU1783]|nr:unnamed protein product [Auanema sp. JU1783]